MGGQTADCGDIVRKDGVFRVVSVQKDKGGKFLHYGHLISGEISVDDTVTHRVDKTAALP
jgi:alanyl-tRNA synthetase